LLVLLSICSLILFAQSLAAVSNKKGKIEWIIAAIPENIILIPYFAEHLWCWKYVSPTAFGWLVNNLIILFKLKNSLQDIFLFKKPFLL